MNTFTTLEQIKEQLAFLSNKKLWCGSTFDSYMRAVADLHLDFIAFQLNNPKQVTMNRTHKDIVLEALRESSIPHHLFIRSDGTTMVGFKTMNNGITGDKMVFDSNGVFQKID